MILIHRTYTECTPESAEDGEASAQGFIVENESCTFRELVSHLQTCSESSSQPCMATIYEWFSTDAFTADYANGTERVESIHYSDQNPERCRKYWRLAAIAAGFVTF